MAVLHRLREYRERNALSQDELATRAGVTRTTVVRLEQRKTGAQPGTLRKLARALSVKPEELLG